MNDMSCPLHRRTRSDVIEIGEDARTIHPDGDTLAQSRGTLTGALAVTLPAESTRRAGFGWD